MKPEPYTLRVTDAESPAPPFAIGDLVKVAAIGFEHSGSCGLVIQQHKAEYLLRFRGAEVQWYAARDLALLSRDPQPRQPFAPGDKVIIAEPGSLYLGNKARITAAAPRDPENLEDMGSGFLLTLRGGHFWAKPHHLVHYRNCGKVLAAIAESAPDPQYERNAQAAADAERQPLYPSPVFKVGDVVQAQRPGDSRFGWFGTVTGLATDPHGCLVQFETGFYWYGNQFLRHATQHELDSHASDDGPAYPYGEPDGPFDEPEEPAEPGMHKRTWAPGDYARVLITGAAQGHPVGRVLAQTQRGVLVEFEHDTEQWFDPGTLRVASESDLAAYEGDA